MKNRKITALILALAVTAGMFTGCGESQVSNTETETVSKDSVTAPEKDVEMQFISESDAEKELGNDAYIYLDLRKNEDYKKGHIPGAVSADIDKAVQGDFAAGYETIEKVMKDETKNVVLICYAGKKYAQNGTNILSVMDYDMKKVFTLEGGMKGWKGDIEKGAGEDKEVEAPKKDVKMQYISQEDAKEAVNDDAYIFLDLRKNADYEKNHIEGALPADIDKAVEGDFKAGYDKIKELVGDEDKKLVLICYAGKKYAQKGTNILSAMGYDMDKVFTLEGGMKAWK